MVQIELETRHECLANVIPWEIRKKKLKFADTTKWYMHEPESFIDN